MSAEPTVLRAGGTQRIDARNLVPGDVALLQAGDKVPADLHLRLVRTRDLQGAEATLTGESVPLQKASDASYREGKEYSACQ